MVMSSLHNHNDSITAATCVCVRLCVVSVFNEAYSI